jgi:hypothetical protein
MNPNIKKTPLACALGILFLILFSASCSNSEKRIENQPVDFKKYLSEEIKKWEQKIINQTLTNQKAFIGNDSTNYLDLRDFVSTERIFFCFSINTCSPCIDQCIDVIKDVFFDYENEDRIVLVAPDYPARFRTNCYNKPLLTLQNTYFGLELEKKGLPFFLTVNPDLQIKSIHIVNKMDFGRTEKYIRKIKTQITDA